jgi:NAD(P)H dehydrogenase (quinone)
MGRALILYHSQEYGNTDKMAQAVARGAREAGAEVTLVNTNVERMNAEAYRDFDAAAFGSPDYYSYIAGGLKTFLDDWYIVKKRDAKGLTGKPYGLFFTHGGGGKARKVLESLFSRMGRQIGTTIESVGSPAEAELDACVKLGAALAKEAENIQTS